MSQRYFSLFSVFFAILFTVNINAADSAAVESDRLLLETTAKFLINNEKLSEYHYEIFFNTVISYLEQGNIWAVNFFIEKIEDIKKLINTSGKAEYFYGKFKNSHLESRNMYAAYYLIKNNKEASFLVKKDSKFDEVLFLYFQACEAVKVMKFKLALEYFSKAGRLGIEYAKIYEAFLILNFGMGVFEKNEKSQKLDQIMDAIEKLRNLNFSSFPEVSSSFGLALFEYPQLRKNILEYEKYLKEAVDNNNITAMMPWALHLARYELDFVGAYECLNKAEKLISKNHTSESKIHQEISLYREKVRNLEKEFKQKGLIYEEIKGSANDGETNFDISYNDYARQKVRSDILLLISMLEIQCRRDLKLNRGLLDKISDFRRDLAKLKKFDFSFKFKLKILNEPEGKFQKNLKEKDSQIFIYEFSRLLVSCKKLVLRVLKGGSISTADLKTIQIRLKGNLTKKTRKKASIAARKINKTGKIKHEIKEIFDMFNISNSSMLLNQF